MEVVKLRPDLSMEDFNVPLILTVVGGWIIIWCAMLSERIRHGRVGIYSRASMIRKHFHCNSNFELSVLNTGSFLRYHAQISTDRKDIHCTRSPLSEKIHGMPFFFMT